MRRLLVFLVVCTLALGACGRDRGVSGDSPKTASSTGALSSSAAIQRSAAALASAGQAQTQSSVSPRPFPSGPGKRNTMKLDVRLSATCVARGKTLSAKAITEPGAQIAFAVEYSSNAIVPDMNYVPKDANVTGKYTWTWTITPDKPEGEALLTVVVSKAPKGASFNHPFRVDDAC